MNGNWDVHCRNNDHSLQSYGGCTMKENFKTLFFIASIVLNLVFIGTYVTYKLPSYAEEQLQPAPKRPLFLELGLAPEQTARVKAERDKFHARLQELGKEIKARRIELINLLAAIPPDHKAIEKKQEEIQSIQGSVQDRVIMHILQQSTVMTPEQRTRFFQLIKERTEANVQACPPWIKPLGKGPWEEIR